MVRAPCCEKMGLKRGPWTYEEDRILITYINQNGHGNWRALPKRAGLMRCGKSCRLRWMNYLRPDIKRGNFTKIEEETIIKLHQELGNKWSVIAARLPGRTDNEIKNVWHTHLKKRLKLNNRVQHPPIPESAPLPEPVPEYLIHSRDLKEAEYNWGSNSPATSSSDVSSASVAAAASDDFTETGFLKSWSEDFGGSEWSGESAVEYGNWCGSELGFEIGDDFGYGVLGNHIHTTNEFIELPEIWQ